MRALTCCAAVLLSAITACADDPSGIPTTWTAPPSALAATDPLSNINRLPASLEQKVQSLRTDLETRGYEVARGYWTLWGVEDCKYPIQTVGYCYGNNPTAPYALAVVPQWKDEYSDQRFHHILNEPLRNMIPNYRLDRREAVVILAEMPPIGRYFGIHSNVFTREAAFNSSDPILPRVASDPLLQSILFGGSPDSSRRMMIASIGNTINNVVIERKSGAVWGEQRYFVITSDADIADAMTAALLRAAVPSANDVFVEPVSPNLVRTGLERSSDDLITYIRYLRPESNAAGEQWRQQLPLTVLRVRAKSGAPSKPFAIPAYGTRTANYDETQLRNDLNALVNAVRARWSQPAADTASFFSTFKLLDLVGQHCLGFGSPLANRGPMDCLGDNWDADYQISRSVSIDGGKVVALVGTLATANHNATYVSLSVNRFPLLVGVKNIADEELEGGAASFASALQHDARFFYVQYVARDCSGLPHCIEIPTNVVPSGEIIKLIQRNYVNQGSVNGPDPTKIINPISIVFDGSHRPQ